MKMPTASKGSEPHRGFPLDVFPERIQRIVNEYQKAFRFEKDWLGLTILTALSAAIGTGYRAEVRPLHIEPAILWSVLIGASGSAKTHVIDHLFKPFTNLDHEKYDIYQKELDLLEGSDNKKKGRAPRFYPSVLRNFTFEALAEASAVNPHGCVVLSDEILGFTKNMNAYNKGNDEPHYLTLFSGGAFSTTRKTQQAIHTRRSCINIIGGIQPERLRDLLTAQRFQSGFAGRFLFSFPEAGYKPWPEYSFDKSLNDDYHDIIRGIREAGDPHNPKTLTFGPEAWESLLAWQKENTEYANDLKDYGDIMAGLRKKWESYVCRFALILQVVSDYCNGSEPEFIEIDAVKGAIRLFDHFLMYSHKAFALIDRPAELDGLSEKHRHFYESLPERFTTGDAQKIADSLGISQSAMYSFFAKQHKLFKKIKQGHYQKAVV